MRQHFESLQAAALPAAELAGAVVAPEAGKEEEPEDLREFVGKRLMMTSKLIARVIRNLTDETFGATRVAAETNRRYRTTLKKPVDARGLDRPPPPARPWGTPSSPTR